MENICMEMKVSFISTCIFVTLWEFPWETKSLISRRNSCRRFLADLDKAD